MFGDERVEGSSLQPVSLVVLCYPTLGDKHQRAMDDLRSEHDLIYKDVVRPHFTMVFPVRDMATDVLQEHVRIVSASSQSFRFACRYAMVHNDESNDNWYVFLVPDEGFSRIARLHDKLYVGILASQLRLDLPYVPHIGIATNTDRSACKLLADRLNRTGFEIDGLFQALTICEYNGAKVTDLQRIPLAAAAD